MSAKKKWYAVGAALLLLLSIFILLVFSMLGDAGGKEQYLADSRDERFGWSYELLVDGQAQAYEPEFADEGYVMTMPEGTEAVRITRTMTEQIPGAELEWMSYLDGVEVFLDGELLYTDFREARRDADGFLRPTKEEWDRLHQRQGDSWQMVRMSLPADYSGKELSMTTYLPEEWGLPTAEYPFLGNDDSFSAQPVALSVPDTAVTVVYALLALAMAGAFLLDVSNGRPNGKMLLLCLYFMLLFLDEAYSSYAGYYSALRAHMDLRFLSGLYLAPLYLYLALRLTGRWKYPICGGIVAWALYEGVQRFLNVRHGQPVLYGRTGAGAFVLFLILAAAYCIESVRRGRRSGGKRAAVYWAVGAVIACFYLFERVRLWDSVQSFLMDGVYASVRQGDFNFVVNIIAGITSGVVTVMVAAEVIRRTLRTQQEISVLQERGRQSVEGYHRLLSAQESTKALRHEMRHHFNALAGIIKSGDMERASRYVAAVENEFEQIPTGYYSQNMLVNVIAGNYLDQAKEQGIKTEYQLNVPAELHMADEDLSVFLSNMLQNALEACRRMDPGAERYIRTEMRQRGNFLFVKCVNSAPDAPADETEKRRPDHGYGLTAMRRVAEKYNSVLQLEQGPGEFCVKSNFCLQDQ